VKAAEEERFQRLAKQMVELHEEWHEIDQAAAKKALGKKPAVAKKQVVSS
jgi:hypothetical protein